VGMLLPDSAANPSGPNLDSVNMTPLVANLEAQSSKHSFAVSLWSSPRFGEFAARSAARTSA